MELDVQEEDEETDGDDLRAGEKQRFPHHHLKHLGRWVAYTREAKPHIQPEKLAARDETAPRSLTNFAITYARTRGPPAAPGINGRSIILECKRTTIRKTLGCCEIGVAFGTWCCSSN